MADDSAPPLRLPSIPDALRRHRGPAVGVLLAFLVGAVLFTLLAPAPVTGTAQLGLTDPRGNSVFRTTGSLPTDLARFTQQQATFARSNQVLQRADVLLDEDLGLNEFQDLVSTEVGANADVLSITAQGPDAATAAARANAVAEAYRELTREQTDADAEAALEALEQSREPIEGGEARGDLLRELDLQASQLRLAAQLYGDGVAWSEPADPALAGGGPALLRNLVIAGLLGVMGGVALAVALAARRPTTEDADAPFAALGAPLLGELALDQPDRGFDVVAATLHGAAPGGVIAVSAPGGNEDLAWFCADLAKAAARAGLRVAAFDGALRGASLATMLQERPLRAGGAGAGSDGQERGLIPVQMLTASEATLSRADLSVRLEDLRAGRDLVLVNCPPMHAAAATTLLQASDAVLAVVHRGAPEAALRRWRRMLGLLEARLLGYVFVETDRVKPKPPRSAQRQPVAAASPARSRVPARSSSYSPAGG